MMLTRYTFPILLLSLLTAAQTAQAQCTTNAGTISGPSFLCEGNTLSINNMGNETLDANDILIFVAYTGAAPNATTVFATSTTVNFPYQSSFLTNSPFKVAAVAGNNAGGTVDWDDPCLSVSNSLTVTCLPPPTVTTTGGTLTCTNPFVVVTASVNQQNCSFLWSNGNTTPIITVQQPGQYCVTVTNQAGCTETQCATVTQDIAPPIADAGPDQLLNCFTTQVTLNGSQSSTGPNFTYLWSGPGVSPANQNVLNPTINQPGVYTLVVTNTQIGCTATDQVLVLADIAPPVASAGPDTGIPCGGGTVTLAGSAQGGQFVYAWNGPGITSGGLTLSPVVNSPGVYSLTVTNTVNGCTATDAVTVFPGPAIPQQDFVVTNTSCQGGNTGSINMTPPASGQPPFDFAWTGPSGFSASTEDISGIAPGIYNIVATDATGCAYHANVVVVQVTPITIPLPIIVTPVTCSGSSDGAISFAIVGGTPPYTLIYQWNGMPSTPIVPPANQVVLNNLPPGLYIFTVTDANGCSAVSPPIAIVQSLPFIVAVAPINCGDNSAQVIVTGGTPPYTYQWSNGSTAPVITNLLPGTYSITVTDANGCQQVVSLTIGPSGSPLCGFIMGRVVKDSLNNCLPDSGEPGLSNWIVRADDSSGNSYYGVSDSTGTYRISVDEGDYTLTLFPPSALWMPCFATLPLGAVAANDTTFAGDFLAQTIATCPALSVSIGTSQLRRCFSTNYYFLSYCNNGTAPAGDAYILVTLDPFLSPVSASLPYLNLGNNVLRFNIGDMEVGECGYFNLQVSVSCNAALGQTHCTEAHIYPDSTCLPPDPQWSGASLQVSSQCDADSVRFSIKNTGAGDMSGALEYIVVEDMVMLTPAAMPPLQAGDSVLVIFPANGKTYRIFVQQEPLHPGNSQPTTAVEGCGANGGFFSVGFINQFPNDDAAAWIDIDCTPNTGSYDPNDKQGFPVGYGAAHYIRPGTELEYLIRFQNTGTDTAFTVRVVDTLSAWLDPATVRPGASSHAYRFDLTGAGIVEFLFENILLPDSNVNQAASNGFVKFSIGPKENAPLETVIENDAAIYFDFNAPVVTNTTLHRLGEDFLVSAWQPRTLGAEVSVSPNPFGDEARLEVKGLRSGAPLRLRVFDLRGVAVREMETPGAVFNLKKGDWPAGIYLFHIQQEGKWVGNGKLVVK